VSKKTILLAQKNVSFVNSIELQKGTGQSLILKKLFIDNKTAWVGILQIANDTFLSKEEPLEEVIFPVDLSKITQLLQYAVQERTIGIVSDDSTEFKTYNLSSDTAFQMIFKGIDDKNNLRTFSHLYFGSADITGRSVIFRTSGANGVYRTVDDFYSFCSTDPSAWVDGKFLPDVVLAGRTVNQVKYITFQKDIKSKTIINTSDLEHSIASTLFSMQSNIVVSEKNLQNAQLKYSIKVSFIDNTTVSFSVYETSLSKTTNRQTFFVVPEHTQTYSYILEISEWSVQRIEELF
jgi:hypothetical protein